MYTASFPHANYLQVGELEETAVTVTTTGPRFARVQCMRCGMLWVPAIHTVTVPASFKLKNLPAGAELSTMNMELSHGIDGWDAIGSATGKRIGITEPETWRCCHRGERH